jgi:hypothetical protein
MTRTTIRVDRFRLPDGTLVTEEQVPEDIETEYTVVHVHVEAYIAPYRPARTLGPVEQCYPEEGGDIEDLTATVGGKLFTLTPSERAYAEDVLLAQTEPDDYEP